MSSAALDPSAARGGAHGRRRQRSPRLSARGPLLLVFLRHFGCPLCQEMVADVAARRAAMAASGTTVVFVHMHPEPQAAAFFARFGVSDLQRVSDPARTLYRAFGVPRGATVELVLRPGSCALLVGDRRRRPPARLRRRRRRPDVRRGPPGRRPHRARGLRAPARRRDPTSTTCWPVRFSRRPELERAHSLSRGARRSM